MRLLDRLPPERGPYRVVRDPANYCVDLVDVDGRVRLGLIVDGVPDDRLTGPDCLVVAEDLGELLAALLERAREACSIS